MAEKTTTIRVTLRSRALLRRLAAEEDVNIQDVVERLATAEWKKVARQIAESVGNDVGYDKWRELLAEMGVPHRDSVEAA